MKNLTYFLFLLMPMFCFGQNHVINGNFEYYTGCPSAISQFNNVRDWRSFILNTTPEFYHTCATSNQASVPTNYAGTQAAASGNGYAGLFGYVYLSEWREIITSRIIPLTPNQAYEVSMSISLADSAQLYSNNIDVFFFDTLNTNINYSASGPNSFISIQPQVQFNYFGAVSSINNWVRVAGLFIADSAYDNIAIGGFCPGNIVQYWFTGFNGLANSPMGSYYYIDSIVVKQSVATVITDCDTMLCTGDTFLVKYKAFNTFQSNNNFIIQLSDAFGGFANAITIGSITSNTHGQITCIVPDSIGSGNLYRLRIISTNVADTTIDNGRVIRIGNIDSANITVSTNSPVCAGSTLSFTGTYVYPANYSWVGPNSFRSANNNLSFSNASISRTGRYILTSDIYGCKQIDTVYAVVNPKPTAPTISFISPLCTGETLQMSALGSSSSSYHWYGPAGFTANSQNITRPLATLNYSGTYAAWTDNGLCNSDTDYAAITINPQPYVTIASIPADSICYDQVVSFTATPHNASTAATYQWFVNGINVYNLQNFTTAAINDQDQIYCDMTDNNTCIAPKTDRSNYITMTVLPYYSQSVSISVNPVGKVSPGTLLTFTANISSSAPTPNPALQWKKNGNIIPGATNNIWSSSSLTNNDIITLEIVDSQKCLQPTLAYSNSITVEIGDGVNISETEITSGINLVPNPNRGQFVLSGQLNYNGNARISVVNMLGQTIYQTDSKIINHQLYQNIELPKVANGIYHLLLETEGDKMNIKFSIE